MDRHWHQGKQDGRWARVPGSIACGKLVCSWALAWGQRANRVLASWTPLLKLPGEFCFMKFPATWDPCGLVIRSLEVSLLYEKKKNMCLKSLGRAVGESSWFLPDSHCVLTEAAPTTAYCQLLLSPEPKKIYLKWTFWIRPIFKRIHRC